MHIGAPLPATLVVPRPIALVGPDSIVNAAPFSFFNVFGEDSALVVLDIQSKADGTPKDTLKHTRMRASAKNSPSSANPLPNGGPRTAPTRRGSAPRRGPDPGGLMATGAVARIATFTAGRDSGNRGTASKSRALARIQPIRR
jgi:hypothetical protein